MLMAMVSRFLQSRFILMLLVAGGTLLLVRCMTTLDALLIMKWVSHERWNFVAYSWSTSSIYVAIASSIGLPALTLILARRGLRSDGSAKIVE